MHSRKRCGELEMAEGNGEMWRWQKGTDGWIRGTVKARIDMYYCFFPSNTDILLKENSFL